MKCYPFHGAKTIQCVPLYVLLLTGEGQEFRLWAVDFRLAYLKSDKSLIRKIFITDPAPESDPPLHECLELLKLVYG